MARRAQRLLRELDPVIAVAAVVLALGAVQLFAGALESGVTIDEPVHADRAASWIDDGWYVPASLLVDGQPDPNEDLASPYVYGPAFEATAHVANVLAGNESLEEISRSAGAYRVRHLTAAALALLAVGAVGAAVRFLTGSRRFGLWAAAGLLAVPEWTGQAFFNPKDIPAACGYTLVTAALILALGEDPGGATGRRRRWAIGALVAAGFFFGAGTRLSLVLPFAASLAVYAALRLGQRRLGGVRRDGGADLAVAGGAGIGIAAIAVVYPDVARKPLTLLAETASGSADYPWQGVTLTAGQLLPEHPPWWYLPVWIGASLPVLLGILAVVGAALGIRALTRARGAGWRGALWSRPELGLVLVLQQALLLSLGAILVGAVMYSGMRQHLYVLPAVAILAGVGAQRLWAWAGTRSPQRRWRGGATALLCAALLVPMAEQALLFPYNYTYVNPLAGIGGVNDRWETDFWFASAPEALSRVPTGADLRCSARLVPRGSTAGPALTTCTGDQFGPFAGMRGTAVPAKWRNDRSAVWVIARKRAGNHPPDYCEQADDVTRWLRGETVTMAFVLRCDPLRAR